MIWDFLLEVLLVIPKMLFVIFVPQRLRRRFWNWMRVRAEKKRQQNSGNSHYSR